MNFRGICLTAGLVAGTLAGPQVAESAPQPNRPPAPTAPATESAAPCADAPFRQFDFFIGDWDVYDAADPQTIVARNTVTVVLDGCALLEVHRLTDGLQGESFSAYDPARRLWHQSWFTNRASVLLLDGNMEGDRMVLTATLHAAGRGASLLRGTWKSDGVTVRQVAERSRDGGHTWTPAWDLLFRPHAPAAPDANR
jgi:hypothetical protein